MTTLHFNTLSTEDKKALEANVLEDRAKEYDACMRKQQREAKVFPYRHPIEWYRIRRMVRSWR